MNKLAPWCGRNQCSLLWHILLKILAEDNENWRNFKTCISRCLYWSLNCLNLLISVKLWGPRVQRPRFRWTTWTIVNPALNKSSYWIWPIIIIIIIIIITTGFGDPRSINTTGITFFSELGRRLTDVSGDPRETTYLFQRVSLAVQRYNSVAFRGTFSVPTKLD